MSGRFESQKTASMRAQLSVGHARSAAVPERCETMVVSEYEVLDAIGECADDEDDGRSAPRR